MPLQISCLILFPGLKEANGRVALTEMATMGGSVLGAFMLLNSGVFGEQRSKMKAFQIAALTAVAELGAEVITGQLYDSLDYTTDLFENATGIGIPFLP